MIEWIEGLGCWRLGYGVYLNGTGVDCISLPGSQWCDRCEEACGRVEEWRKGVGAEMGEGRRSAGVMLEAREAQDRSDLREMISEMRGRCMVCYCGERSENDKHELQKCR